MTDRRDRDRRREKRGLRCPWCGGVLYTVHNTKRVSSDGFEVRRAERCEACKREFDTVLRFASLPHDAPLLSAPHKSL
jgi:C4-type Zn-finger protein